MPYVGDYIVWVEHSDANGMRYWFPYAVTDTGCNEATAVQRALKGIGDPGPNTHLTRARVARSGTDYIEYNLKPIRSPFYEIDA